jgi:hypothetical protein
MDIHCEVIDRTLKKNMMPDFQNSDLFLKSVYLDKNILVKSDYSSQEVIFQYFLEPRLGTTIKHSKNVGTLKANPTSKLIFSPELSSSKS